MSPKTWFRQNQGALSLLFWLLALSVVLGYLHRAGFIAFSWLGAHKNELDASATLTNTIILIGAAALSYFKFFHGRTLSSRAEVKVEAVVCDTPTSFRLHSLTIKVKNVGTAPIWEPRVEIAAFPHGPTEVKLLGALWAPPIIADEFESNGEGRSPMIDTGETASFFAQQEVSDQAWAVTYKIKVEASNGDAWLEFIALRNKEEYGREKQ
jgi:hypothetical protein